MTKEYIKMSNLEKIKEVLNIIRVIDADSNCTESPLLNETPKIEIVILQRGWIVVGRFHKKDHDCIVEHGYVIRQWGTTKGLGEIAMNGPTDKTVIDRIPTTRFHELTIVARMICEESKWNLKIS